MEIRDYSAGDEKAILELFELSFGKVMSPSYWTWRFLENPEKKLMIKLMWDEGKLVGHYAVSPVKLVYKDEEHLTALSMTTMTHPQYGGKGIFTTLAEALYQDIKLKHNVEAVWGFPNTNSHYGFIKNLGWRDLSIIPFFSLDLNDFKLNISSFDNIYLSEEFTQKHSDTFHDNLRLNNKISVCKSVQYLNWRYVDNPTFNYSIFSYDTPEFTYYTVTKVIPSFTDKEAIEIDIVDSCLPKDYSLIHRLISNIISHYDSLYKKQIIKINTWVPLNDPNFINFEKLGFKMQQPLTYFGLRSFGDNLRLEQLFSPNNWVYSMGDSDVF